MSLNTVDLTSAPDKPPICAECKQPSRLATGAETYPDEPHLHDQPMWLCECGAYCRCKPGTLKPIGRPAWRETREIQTEITRLREGVRRHLKMAGRSHSVAKRETQRIVLSNSGGRNKVRKFSHRQAWAVALALENVLKS